MKHYTLLTDLPVLDLKTELNRLIMNGEIDWAKHDNQISLTTMPGHEDDYLLGSGSLVFDFSRAETVKYPDGSEKLEVPKFDIPRQESDFTVLCTQFKNTLFETVYDALANKYHLGRVRLMRSNPKTCLSWHIDYHPRVHYVIDTYTGCFMIIEDELHHLPNNTWWHTNTLLKHTALNSSDNTRVHLVVTILGEK